MINNSSKSRIEVGIKASEILLPARNIDLPRWSVVACDQYTSQPEYWSEVESLIEDSPSAFHLILPEAYLEDGSADRRIENINNTMRKYLEEKVLISETSGFIYVDRKTSHVKSRKGLIAAVDLEEYDYGKGAQSLIRATEGTVIDRLPPRIRIRENAPIELPHIMVLIDDPEKTVIEPLSKKTESFKKLYDFDLMQGGGHITGFKVDDSDFVNEIFDALQKLSQPEVFRAKYNVGEDKGVLLFAVGDGNHSLASAKGHWDILKKKLPKEELEDHPARFALVEIVNVHDEGLVFEPIHRVLFNTTLAQLQDSAAKYFNRNGSLASFKLFESKEQLETGAAAIRQEANAHVIPFKAQETLGALIVKNPGYNLAVGTLQCFLDEFIKTDENIKVDYIHGDETVDSLSSHAGNIGFYLPPMDKCDLFKTVILDGVLPRKTFSMGEAEEKRFYLECRKICK